ncbi:hypothetical protein CPCC7001_609 [Cyanobium sp. PCC 7001]|uniref:hypothetical protein n=1 Tax=Cyanobium sp. PCC 7001 TaxID=180281 RepID=UPI0001804DD6|nr:hypothetical protein [Cyanobium sp. PCC 7001]EDY37730.1 hypothetical protein CPCC7001_609 [Cyanobium sp. PCC 7001]
MVEQQLQHDLIRFVNNPATVRLDAEAGILPHLQGASPTREPLRLALLPDDWRLNQRMSP